MPGPIKQEQLHASLSPITSPQAYPLPTQNPFIVTEEVQPFHLNPEKVELEEHNEQRRGMESTQNTGETAPLCELGLGPAVTPPQPHPGAGVPGEDGSSARTDRGREGGGGSGERGRGQGRGAELQAAGFVQSGRGCRLRFLRDWSKAVHPKPARARAEDQRGAKAGIAETRPLGRPCPRGLPPSTSHGAFPEAPLQPPRATHRHSSSTLSSCRLLDCTPWARAAASRLRLLLRLLPPAAARRPDKRAEGDSGRGGPRSKGSPERDGSGCQESRRAQSGAGSGADARHSAGLGLRAAGLRGGRDHCGCTEGGTQLRTGGGTGPA